MPALTQLHGKPAFSMLNMTFSWFYSVTWIIIVQRATILRCSLPFPLPPPQKTSNVQNVSSWLSVPSLSLWPVPGVLLLLVAAVSELSVFLSLVFFPCNFPVLLLLFLLHHSAFSGQSHFYKHLQTEWAAEWLIPTCHMASWRLFFLLFFFYFWFVIQ